MSTCSIIDAQTVYDGYSINKTTQTLTTLKFTYKGRSFTIVEDGKSFEYESLIGDKIDYDPYNRVYKIGEIKIQYDAYSRIYKIGTIRIQYDVYSRVNQIGNASVNYDLYGRYIGTTGSIE